MGLSFEQIATKMGNRSEVWVAALFYSQAKPAPEDIVKLSSILGLDEAVRLSLGVRLTPPRAPRHGREVWTDKPARRPVGSQGGDGRALLPRARIRQSRSYRCSAVPTLRESVPVSLSLSIVVPYTVTDPKRSPSHSRLWLPSQGHHSRKVRYVTPISPSDSYSSFPRSSLDDTVHQAMEL